jgi:hypothetical protein
MKSDVIAFIHISIDLIPSDNRISQNAEPRDNGGQHNDRQFVAIEEIGMM